MRPAPVTVVAATLFSHLSVLRRQRRSCDLVPPSRRERQRLPANFAGA